MWSSNQLTVKLIELKESKQMKTKLLAILMTVLISVTINAEARGKKLIVVQEEEASSSDLKDVDDPRIWAQEVESNTQLFVSSYGKKVCKHLNDVKETIAVQSEIWKVKDEDYREMFKKEMYRDLIANFKAQGYMEYTATEKAEMEKATTDPKTGLLEYNGFDA
jgi:hypothetical protein